jgi:phenylpyruvate tautomerase PptA (4-oxalocrotonate tautomerase family)/ketosteroid isomerase-like protein
MRRRKQRSAIFLLPLDGAQAHSYLYFERYNSGRAVAMPVVEIHLLQGYGADDKRRLGEALTDAVRLVVPAAPEAVTVLMHELPADAYLRGRQARTPAPALPDPARVVLDYLAAMERRDLDAARAMLAEGFAMRFPGSPVMTTLDELIAWSAPRYRAVRKSFEGVDVAPGADGVVVHCRGTLSGEWPDGAPFEGIRFVDRFELRGGLIARQDVWNDLAEARAAR